MVGAGLDDLCKPDQAWAFFKRIGAPRCITAPMVEGSELAFRMMTRRFGADLCVTPMFNANVFVRCGTYRSKVFTTCPQDRPLGVQFASHDPETLLQAARLVEHECDFVDINLGCPQKIAKKGRYGAFLMQDRATVAAMVRRLATDLSIPVTCKIRVFDSFDETLALARLIESSGCSMLTVHGRTKEERADKVGPCDWDVIRRLKAALRIPVVANGGVGAHDDIGRCIAATGVDGVMASEGLLANPALFDADADLSCVDLAQIYLDHAIEHDASFAQVVLHVVKILFPAIQAYPEIRELLCVRRERSVATMQEAIDLLRQYDAARLERMGAFPTWYMRHRTPYRTVVDEPPEPIVQ